MRMLMKVQMPTDAGNEAIRNGTLPNVMLEVVKTLGAEAAYFLPEDGMRTALIFFEMGDSSEIPPAAEPFFMGLQAKVTLAPVMNAAELQAGVEKARAAVA